MYVSKSVAEYWDRRGATPGMSLGFVPTMGALHAGHEALVKRSVQENEATVVSIFINPTQFNDPKDLERYPRTIEVDLVMLAGLGVTEVFCPTAEEVYPEGYRFHLEAEFVAGLMEGKHRPGFLQGVMTVVLKLLNIVQPQRAYFGEKDYQQLVCIQEMVREFFLQVEIVPCETVREASGLAMSSRNALLSVEGRAKAAVIYRALSCAATAEEAAAMIEAAGLRVEYVEEHWNRRFAAAFLEGVRLIDNVALGA
jgi:pantoate--beta-alanine ligase